MTNIKKYRYKLEQKKGQQKQVQENIARHEIDLKTAQDNLANAQQAQLIIQVVAQETQEQLEYHLNELVSLAMIAIFGDDAYALKMAFEIKRGKTEVQPKFERNEMEYNPILGTGGGPVDVAALTLRPTLWNLEKPHRRAVLFLDEPLRFLSVNLHEKAAELLSEISHRLGLQIIMVTHSEALAEKADKVFVIDQKDGQSFIKEVA